MGVGQGRSCGMALVSFNLGDVSFKIQHLSPSWEFELSNLKISNYVVGGII